MRHCVLSVIALGLMFGCGHHYSIVGESDTSKPISVSIMKTGHGQPERLYYTELTGNGTEFVFDRNVDDSNGQVEAWFEMRDHPGQRTVYALPSGRRVHLKLDHKHDAVVIEDTKIEGTPGTFKHVD